MKRPVAALVGISILVLESACATSNAPRGPEAPLVSPAELLASLADVANGRNPDMAETGLALKTIELRLLVGRENRAGAGARFLVLDVDATRRSELSFTESFTLELPPPERRRAVAAAPVLPGVVEFVEAAMSAARDLAAAAARGGLPQKLREVELTARIVRSTRAEGGIAFTGLTALGATLSGGAGTTREEANTVRLVFTTR